MRNKGEPPPLEDLTDEEILYWSVPDPIGSLMANKYNADVPLCPQCLDDHNVQFLYSQYLKEGQTAHRCTKCRFDWIVQNQTEQMLKALRAEVDGFKLD